MKNYKIIGLTGQSGAGKSTVAKLFESKNAFIINADILVNELYEPHSPCLKMLSAVFGKEIINSDKTLNRKKLAEKAFATKENTQLINSLVHPYVIMLFLKKLKSAVSGGSKIIVFDAPQLFESNADVFCDYIVSVTADKDRRIKRICGRDGISEKQALRRINAQLDEEFFKNNSDYIIENNDDFKSLQSKFDEFFNSL